VSCDGEELCVAIDILRRYMLPSSKVTSAPAGRLHTVLEARIYWPRDLTWMGHPVA
jgi:hypothetical protein